MRNAKGKRIISISKSINPIVKQITSILLIFTMILSYMVIASGTTSDDINQAKDKQKDTQKEINDTKNLLAQLEKDKTDALSYINALNKEMNDIDFQIYDLNQQIAEKEAQIIDNEAQLEQAKIDSKEQYAAMKLRIQYMYEHKSESYIEVLLASKDMGDMLNKAEYFNKITSYDREMLVKYVETEKTIQDTEVALQNEHAELETAMVSVESQKSSLALVESAKKTELANINAKAEQAAAYKSQQEKADKEQEATIVKMEADNKRQMEAEAAAAAKGPSGTSTLLNYNGGTFAWPVLTFGVISSRFGDTDGRTAKHNGLDIRASISKVEGEKIVAASDGIVTAAEYAGTAGNWIWINHGGGLYTVYMHLLKINVSYGDHVTKGQVIGLMGGNPSATSGESTGAHLHFGVRLNGVYVDPLGSQYLNHQ